MAADVQAQRPEPNVVLIMTDDEDVAAHAFMPKTKALIEDQGATFANYFISYPWCCPSRASILRGQYAHNTNVVGNEPPWGGYETFHGLGLEQSTLATWLQAAGYRTAMIGKYLNRYVPENGRRAARLERLVCRRQRPCELRLRPQRERPDGALRPRAARTT